jgi:hypothetical protein
VPDRDFEFAVRVAEPFRLDEMLTELAGRLLGRLGYGDPDVADVVASIGAELDRGELGRADGRLLEFSTRDGQLQIVMSFAGGRTWRLARPLP